MSLSKTRLRGSDEGRAPLIYAASQGEEDESHLALLGRIFRFTASHCSGHFTWRAGIDRKKTCNYVCALVDQLLMNPNRMNYFCISQDVSSVGTIHNKSGHET